MGASKGFLALILVIVTLCAIVSLAAGISGLLTVTMDYNANQIPFIMFVLAIVAGGLLLVSVLLSCLGMFKKKSGGNTHALLATAFFCLFIGFLLEAAAAAMSIVGWMQFLIDPQAATFKIWNSLPSNTLQGIQNTYGCTGFTACAPTLIGAINMAYKWSCVALWCVTAILICALLLLCNYMGDHRADSLVTEAKSQVSTMQQQHQEALKTQEQQMANQYTVMLQQNAQQYQNQVSQFNSQLSLSTATVAQLRAQLQTKDAVMKDQVAQAYQQGSVEMQTKMLEQARVREQQLLEDARHNEAVAYAKGLSEGAAVISHKPLTTSPSSPNGATFAPPGPPPGITAPAPLETTVPVAIGATSVAMLTATQSEPIVPGATVTSVQSMDPVYGTVVSQTESEPTPVGGTIISETVVPTGTVVPTEDIPVGTIVPSETVVPPRSTVVSQSSVGGTVMPGGNL